MAVGKTFKLSEDINLNVGNKNINIMKGYPRAPDLASKVESSGNLIKFKQIFLSVRGQQRNMFISYFSLKLFHL